jgi:Roadblock/LC7 domain
MVAANLKLLDDTFKRLSSVPGVLGVLVCTTDGVPIRTTLEPQIALQYAALTLNVSQVARRTVKQLSHATYGTEAAQQEDQKRAGSGACYSDAQAKGEHLSLCSTVHADHRIKNVSDASCAGGQLNELQHVRLRTAKHEIMIVVPEDQLDYFMVVVHATDTNAA